jgi:hypothetical protein
LSKTTEVLSSVARSALRYFFALYQTAQFKKKKVIEYKMRVLIFSTTIVQTFLIEELSEM